MSAIVVLGTQWGDEGKGKITDYMASKAQIVTRYQGGNNAGHTIVIGEKRHALHLIPSGIFHQDKICVMGNGMVIDPRVLKTELEYIQSEGYSTDNLKISNRAHIILPYHNLLDELQEKARGDRAIGTTKKGIGPAYTDKAIRCGIRVCDLIEPDTFAAKLKVMVEEKNLWITKVYGGEPVDYQAILDEYSALADLMRPYVVDTSALLNDELENGKNIVFEGAQGTMLDYDHGTYPFVTSSNPIGYCVGAGVGPRFIDEVVGVAKAYTSRVGEGIFPTELDNPIGQRIREIGREYGTTTGRPRRVGWFDAVVVKHSCRVAGVTGMTINSLDVLSGLEEVKVCVGYRYQDEIIREYPASEKILEACEPVYETLPGWSEDITGVTRFEDLPVAVQNYILLIQDVINVPIIMFSVGPERQQTAVIRRIW